MKDVSCKIIEDLIPLVRDGIASDQSVELVKSHIKHCKSCEEVLKGSNIGEENMEVNIGDEKIIRQIKKSLLSTQIIILIIGGIIGVALTNSMGMFYNFAIMPLLGGLSIVILGRKWYLLPLGVILLSYIWQIVELSISHKFVWPILYGAMYLSGIYGALLLLGVIIALLLRFAFRKENERYEG